MAKRIIDHLSRNDLGALKPSALFLVIQFVIITVPEMVKKAVPNLAYRKRPPDLTKRPPDLTKIGPSRPNWADLVNFCPNHGGIMPSKMFMKV